jgi:hypothetical protein
MGPAAGCRRVTPPSPPPPRQKHEWLVNVEADRPLHEIAQTLETVASKLRTDGSVKLNGVAVTPPDPCEFMVRYERLPHGEMKLKLELTWEPDAVDYRSGHATGLDIE